MEDISTDLSKLDSGQTAADYCIPEVDIEYSCRLPDDVTVFTAWKLSQNYERYRYN